MPFFTSLLAFACEKKFLLSVGFLDMKRIFLSVGLSVGFLDMIRREKPNARGFVTPL